MEVQLDSEEKVVDVTDGKQVKQVNNYMVGDIFSSDALWRDCERSTSCVAATQVTILGISTNVFNQVSYVCYVCVVQSAQLE